MSFIYSINNKNLGRNADQIAKYRLIEKMIRSPE